MTNPARRTHSRASILAVCLVIAVSTPAQQSTVEATALSQTGQPQFTIRARVPLTIVDVVVTDAKGHPVHGLKQSDFTLFEDNQPMHSNSFEEHRSDETPAAEPTQLSLPPNTFTNAAPAPPTDRPINVLLIDSLNTPMAAQVVARNRMLDFVDKLPAGTRIKVLALSGDGHLTILQGLTADRELLKAAINSRKPQFAPFEDPGQETPGLEEPLTMEEEASRTNMRIRNQISSMKQVARYLSGLPGRKNLIWFTASSPLQFPPQPIDPDLWPPNLFYDEADGMRSAGDSLARAHVAVYSVDSRSLEIMKPKSRKYELHYAEWGTMEMLADLTGGKAFYNTNGTDLAAGEAINLGGNYYTLTYTPTNQTLDTRFRTISVKVSQPNLHLTYRNGYYAVDPDTDSHGKTIQRVTPMQAAMMRGSLEPTQILFKVNVVQSRTTDAKLSADNQPDPKQMKPPYRHYSIAYAIDVHGIDFAPGPDGNFRGAFEYGVRVYNADGDEIVNSVSKVVNPILPPAVYKSMLNGGANAHQEIDLPATGNYFLRIAVHDLATDHVGAIEIPAASITANLTPTIITR